MAVPKEPVVNVGVEMQEESIAFKVLQQRSSRKDAR